MRLPHLVTICLLSVFLATGLRAQSAPAVLADIGTGTWCQWCPYADYTIDSVRARIGNDLVVLFWHGPAAYSDPFWIPQEDSLADAVGATSYPWLSVGRKPAVRGLATPTAYPNSWDSVIRGSHLTGSAASVEFTDIRVDDLRSQIAFDITLALSEAAALPSTDTALYKLFVAITEDSLTATQERGAAPGYTKASIADFVHNDVVRTVAGSVLGDSIRNVEKLRQSGTAILHYRIPIDANWNPAHCRIKAVLFWESKATREATYIDAVQSAYLTSYTSPANPIAVITPHEGDTLFIGRTVPVTFSVSANITASRSLQYTTDNGNEWKVFGSVNNATSYQWTVPNTPTTEARVRIVDDNGETGVSGVFSIVPSGSVTSLTVTDAPRVPVNSIEAISWNVDGLVGSQADIDVSYDNKQTWYPIITGLDITGTSSYSWKTPSFTTKDAIIRASFSSGATGYTTPFDLVEKGSVRNGSHIDTYVHPNPADQFLQLPNTALRAGHVTMYDELGRAVTLPVTPCAKGVRVETSTLPAGSYAVRNGDELMRIIIRH